MRMVKLMVHHQFYSGATSSNSRTCIHQGIAFTGNVCQFCPCRLAMLERPDGIIVTLVVVIVVQSGQVECQYLQYYGILSRMASRGRALRNVVVSEMSFVLYNPMARGNARSCRGGFHGILPSIAISKASLTSKAHITVRTKMIPASFALISLRVVSTLA
jgi:hypothetical protein